MKLFSFITLVAVGVFLTTAADVLLKKSSVDNFRYLLAGMLVYALVGLPVAFAFRLSSFGALFIVWESATVTVGLITAALYFHEPLNLNRILALVFAIVAVMLSSGLTP